MASGPPDGTVAMGNRLTLESRIQNQTSARSATFVDCGAWEVPFAVRYAGSPPTGWEGTLPVLPWTAQPAGSGPA